MRLRRETSVMLEVQLDGPGIVRYIATPEGYSVEVNATTGERNFSPSVAEIRNGSWGTGVLATGIINVTTANTTFTANVTNLTKIGRNDLWVATSSADDLAAAPAVAMLDATTRDATPPHFVPWYNASTPITYPAPDGVDVAVALDEPGYAYVHVLAPAAQVPSGEQVKERALANYTWTKWTEVTKAGALYGSAVFGLQSGTRYAVYLTVEDLWEPERNILEPAMRWEFYTFDATPPRGAISLGTVTNEGFEIMGESNKNGTVRFVVVPSANEKKPTFWDVMFGVGYGQKQPISPVENTTAHLNKSCIWGPEIPRCPEHQKYDDDPRMTFGNVSAKGVFNVSGVGAYALGAASLNISVGVANGSAVVEGLSSDTAYDVYAVVSDAAENPAPGQTVNHNVTVLTILNVVTLDDTPPALIGENTTGGTVANVKPASFDLVTRLNEPGRVWYVVTPHVAPAVAVFWNDTCFDRYSHGYFKPVSGDFKLKQPPLPHIGLLDPREHEYVCPSEDAVDSGLGDRVRWIGAPTVEEVMMGVGPNRTQAAACGYADVPTANVSVTTTIASVFDPSAEVDRCANWTTAYNENVTGGVYTAMDDRAASDAQNDGRRGVGDMWVYGWYHGEYLTEDYAIGNWSKWVANASDLPAYPEHPTCRTCPRLSPEGAYDVWIVAEDDGNDLAYNSSAAGNGTITDFVATSRNRQAHATKVMVINPTDWHGPTVVMADNTTATFVPGYPKLTSLNGTAMKLEVALNESGAFVFSLRPGTNDSAALNRSQIESAAGWNVSYQALMLKPWMEEKTMTFDNYNYLHNWFLKDPPEEAKKYPDLQLGANAGVIWAKNATVPVIHVITDVPRPSSWIGEDRQGPTLAIDYFVVDEEPTRGSSLTQPNWDGSTHHLAVRMKDVLAPLWTAGPFVSGVAVPASSVDDMFLPAGSKVGSQYARLVVNAAADERGVVYFVVCAAPAEGSGDEPTPTVEQVINATVCDDSSYPKIAAASFVVASDVATEWQSLGYPLVQGSEYVAYLVAADDTTTGAGYNAQDNVTVVRFIAEDMRPPVFSDLVGGAPAVVNGTSGGSLTLTFALASPGRALWVVLDGGSPATEPTRAEVVAGTGAGGSTPLARGTVVVSNESYVDSVVTTVIDVTSAGLGAVSSAAAGYSVFVATVPGDDDSFSLVDISSPSSSVDLGGSSSFTMNSKFRGAAATSDGKVIFAPLYADGVGVFDPSDNSFALVDISSTISMDQKFAGAATARSGKVIFPPYKANSVGVFDPSDNSFALVDISATISTGYKFAGAAAANNGKIIFAPTGSTGVGVFDPSDNSFALVDISHINFVTGESFKFTGAAAASNGKVIFAPWDTIGVGVFDPSDDSFDFIDIRSKISTGWKFRGAAAASDGKVVLAPFNADGVGVFDASDNSFVLVDISGTISIDKKFGGAATASNGMIVFAPWNADGVGVFDPSDNSFRLVDISSTISHDDKFMYAAVVSGNKFIFQPLNADSVGVFDFSVGDSYSGNGARHEDVPSTNAAKVAPGLVVDPNATISVADAPDVGALCVGIEALGETFVTLRFAVTGAPATVAYAIMRHALPAPTPAQVLAGTDSKGRAPLAAGGSDFAYTGSASVAGAANLTTAFNSTVVGAGVTNLTRGTRYDIYAVAALTPVDARGGPDGAASPYTHASAPPRLVKRVIRTLDNTAPFFLPGFPRVVAVAPRGVTVAVRVDEAAAVWVVALPTGAPVPSAADVAAAAVHLAGANATPAVAAANATSTSAGVASMALAGAVGDTDTLGTGLDADLGWEPMMLSLSGLSPSKRYDVYATARDFHRDDLPVGQPAKLGTLQGRATKLLASTPHETASLVSLVPSAGSLSPPFSSELSSYRLLVPGDATAAATVSFTATSADLRWKVLADGAELKPGASTSTFIVGEVARTVVFEVEGVSAPSSYSVLLVRADAAVAAAAADDTLAFLAVELDTGERLNSTSMGGAPWPKCAMRCMPPGSPDGCLADRRGCTLDPHRRLYRVVAPVAAKRATVTAVTSRPGASVRVFLGPPAAYAGIPALNSSSADEETWGLAGSVPTPTSTVVDLARVETLAPMPEVAAVYLGVTSADGSRLTYYTIQLRRKGPGAYEGIENRPRNAQDDPPPREYDHFSHPDVVSPVDRVATGDPLTFYPDEL